MSVRLNGWLLRCFDATTPKEERVKKSETQRPVRIAVLMHQKCADTAGYHTAHLFHIDLPANPAHRHTQTKRESAQGGDWSHYGTRLAHCNNLTRRDEQELSAV